MAPAADGSWLASAVGGADRVVVVDCETTGVYRSDRIVELALVTVDLEGQVVERWDTLVHPDRDPGPTHIHGLTAEALQDAPAFADIAGDVAVRLHGACLAAHNLPFDSRMLVGEFDRLGYDLAFVAGLDTLTATRCKLHVACQQHRIPLEGAHAALVDATATAALLVAVGAGCGAGAPVAAPAGVLRSGKVRRRADSVAVAVTDPPHVAALAASLNHEGVEASVLAYLELVDRAVADLHLDADERAELEALAADLGLDAGRRAQAHRRFVNDLIDAALADHVVTSDELDMLLRIAAALDVDASLVEARTRSARTEERTVSLGPGMVVCFTGDDPARPREQLVARARQLGLEVGKGVTKKTGLVIAQDPASSSGKADKARSYGIPVTSIDEFSGAVAAGSLRAWALDARKAITCPDCHATWTVEAGSGVQRSRRCGDCASLGRPAASKPPAAAAAPTTEWLTCQDCGQQWERERTRGRKPLRCPSCA